MVHDKQRARIKPLTKARNKMVSQLTKRGVPVEKARATAKAQITRQTLKKEAS